MQTPEQLALYYVKHGPKTKSLTKAKYDAFLAGNKAHVEQRDEAFDVATKLIIAQAERIEKLTEALKLLVYLKALKDSGHSETPFYKDNKPEAWHKAEMALK